MLKGTETATLKRAALVVGASGGIGAAVLDRYLQDPEYARVYAVSRAPCSTARGTGAR